MSEFVDLYEEIGRDLKNKSEIISVNYKRLFDDASNMMLDAQQFFDYVADSQMKIREDQEQDYYEYLLNGLFCNLSENKGFAKINIFDSRKMIMHNHICISFIQIIVRDKIYVDVHMRSSAYDNALPGDMKFFGSIAQRFIQFCKKNKGHKDWPEITQESINKLSKLQVQLNVQFGSLHKIKG